MRVFVDSIPLLNYHTDHLDGETLIPLWKANPNLRVIVSRANIHFAAKRLQVPAEQFIPIRVDHESINMDPFTFYAVPAAHETLEQDKNGDHHFIGLIVQIGKWTLYHSGDCLSKSWICARFEPYNDITIS